ncbi:MAG TPA: YjjG family noncanonical pyrimidine nucleotidase [Anaerolineales bacterium]|nr:YjjG family noncanonical pyrimidine nucleotidase [Anaerolineales bacterium]
MPKKYDLLLFDLDETLLDFGAAERYAFDALLKEFGMMDDGTLLSAFSLINHKTWAEMEQKLITLDQVKVLRFQRFIEHFSLPFEPNVMAFEYLRKLSENHTEIPGAMNLIRSLSGNYRLGLVTNGLSEVQKPRLRNSGLDLYFEHIFISEEIKVAKPSHEFFSLVFEKFQNPDKRRTIIVGDSMSSDIKGGIDYGIDTCWFNPDHVPPKFQPTYTISDLSQLVDLLLVDD